MDSGLFVGDTKIQDFQYIYNFTKAYDFSSSEVGTKVSVRYKGDVWRGAYNIIIGEVVE